MRMPGVKNLVTYWLLILISYISLGYAEVRDVWLRQIMSHDLYTSFVAIQAHSQSPIGPLSYVRHELVYGSTSLDEPLLISSSSSRDGIGPSVQTLAIDTDMESLMLSEPGGERFAFVIHLGRQDIANEAIYQTYQIRGTGPYVSSGLVSEMWAGVELTRGVDPALSNVILNTFQRARGDLSAGFPGLAGRIFTAYAAYRAANPNLYAGYNSNPNIQSTNSLLNSRMINALESERLIGLAHSGIGSPRISASETGYSDYSGEDASSEAANEAEINFFRQLSGESSGESTQSWRIGVGQYETEAEVAASIANDVEDIQNLDLCATDIAPKSASCLAAYSNGLQRYQGEVSTTVEVRVQGRLQSFTSFAGRALRTAGRLGNAALPVFIILDIVQGQWKAAAWAVGAAAAGVVTDAIVSAAAEIIGSFAGPIGLFIGATVALLFTILPGLFETKNEPLTTNTTEILQWAFFGDAKHTGNEKCNEDLENNGQAPNCTVSYGAGTISSIFKWEIYDASAFLIAMNEGYAMSIPDLANNFTVYDYTNPAASANSPAVIDCGKFCPDPSTNPVTTWNSEPDQVVCAVSDAYACTNPIFRLNRTLIDLPIIRQTANNAYNQVVSGECKIVSDPVEGEVLYPPTQNGNYRQSNTTMIASINAAAAMTSQRLHELNYTNAIFNDSKPLNQTTGSTPVNPGGAMTNESQTVMSPLLGPWSSSPGPPMNFTGKPVAIACNLSADIPDVLSPTYNISRASLYPSPNSSTSGDNSFFVPPPSPNPFTSLNPRSAICLSSSKAPQNLLCLPNGTFPTCQGAFGYSTNSIDAVSFYSASAYLTMNLEQILDAEGNDITPDTFFDDNSTVNDDFKLSMSTATSRKENFTITIPSNIKPPPAMCIYSAAGYSGDVWCMGPGGTNSTSNLVNKAASLTLTDGLAAWLYPKYYGNPLGMQISTSVADLTSIPYLTNQNFKGNMAAAWIYNASTTTA